MTEEKEAIFLEQGSIFPWEIPGKFYFTVYQGSTKLVEFVGTDKIDEVVGSFQIIGSAVKYLADIQRINYDPCIDNPNKEEREMLFYGNICIYKKGQVPGTTFEGYNLEKMGKIWAATKPEDKFRSSNGLRDLVLGDNIPDEKRIEAILKGYQMQVDQAREAKESNDRFLRGYDSSDRFPGMHGGCC